MIGKTGDNEQLLQEIIANKRIGRKWWVREELFRPIFEEGPVGMVLADSEHRIVRANKTLCELMGYSEEELIGRYFDDVTHEEDRDACKELSRQVLQGLIPVFRLEKRYIRKDGGILWVNLMVTSIHGKKGEVLYRLGIIEDLTDLKKANEKIRRLAYYDSLTGLPNRTFFKELLERTIEHAKRYKEKLAVISIELDNFKRINDTLGQSSGDMLLKVVTERISVSLRSSDYVGRLSEEDITTTVSRVGGDHFAVLVQNLVQVQDAAKIANRLLADIAMPYHLCDQEIFITASNGIALYPEDGTDVDEVMQNADTAMGYAKNQGKNNFQFYSQKINKSIWENMLLENDLRKALERNEFLLHYQPRVDAKTKVITGMEALIRWHHPEKGLVMPSQFIPYAESSGLIMSIRECVLDMIRAHLKEWQKVDCRQVKIAVNVSNCQNLLEMLGGFLQSIVFPPQCLELEITENTIMRNPKETVRILEDVKAMGVKMVIDDFGTGYSSLSYLQRLPLDYLKIDRSFVKNLASNPNDQAIVEATIAMAHSLKLKVIAEGIETNDQLAFLQEQGCDEIQGFLFSQPLSVEKIPEVLAKGSL